MTLTLDTHAEPRTGPAVEVVPVPVAKRLLDLVLSGIGLLLSSPLWLVLAALVKTRRRRTGLLQPGTRRRGRPRLPRVEVPLDDPRRREVRRAPCRPPHNDPRVTRIGRVMRGERDGRTAAALEHLRRRHELRRAARAAPGRDRGARQRRAGAARGRARATASDAACGRGSPASRRSTRRATSRAGTSSATTASTSRSQSLWLDVRLIALSFWITFRGRWEARDAKI